MLEGTRGLFMSRDSGFAFRARSVSPDFSSIAAHLHVAPAAASVARGVNEKPRAAFSGTRFQTVNVLGGEKVGGGLGNPPGGSVQILLLTFPCPDETFLVLSQALVLHRFPVRGVQQGYV